MPGLEPGISREAMLIQAMPRHGPPIAVASLVTGRAAEEFCMITTREDHRCSAEESGGLLSTVRAAGRVQVRASAVRACSERLGIPGARDMAFNVLSQHVETEDRSEVLAEGASLEEHSQVSEFVVQIVAAARRRSSIDGGTATTSSRSASKASGRSL